MARSLSGSSDAQTLLVELLNNLSTIKSDGAEHIWIGFDHLLFLLCLIWIAGTWKRILITVTGFTIAHSITLVGAALELVSVPVLPVEACIALSIVFLAREIAVSAL